jgi:hypothetical protein
MNEELENDEQKEGIISDQGDVLGLDLDDEEIAELIGNRVEDAVKWWDKELNLTEVRKKGEEYYLNKPFDEDELYDHEVPYKENRIFTAIETLIPMITSQPAEPIVTEAQDTDESRQLAMDFSNVLLALYEDLHIKAKLGLVARHLMSGKRVGVLKYYFDPDGGRLKADGTRMGKLRVDVVRPEKIVFEQESTDPENVTLICEYMTSSIEKLIQRFPKKKDEIFKKYSIVKGTKKQLQKIVGYQEVWFTYFDKEGNQQENHFR